MRSVRRRLRKELSTEIAGGNGDLPTLRGLTRQLLGHSVGFEVLIDAWCANETSNALAQLRIAGEAESVGKMWKPVDVLTDADVEAISIRRLKRMRGELKAQERLAHEHGRISEAAAVARLLEIIGQELCKREPVSDAASVSA
jgi:hypothetical protein